jgi:formamidopyrimidine-DNA glycosylase
MPELPEVETTRVGISPHIIDQQVMYLEVRNGQLRWPVPTNLASQIEGCCLRDVIRRGKYLLLKFDDGCVLLHLGMTGSLRVLRELEPPTYHDHFDICFGPQLILRYRDPRRFGCLLWSDHPVDQHPLLAHLGPEPLSTTFTGAYLQSTCRGRRQAIKSLIMDSRQVVGVGNIYANEALYMAGIHPHRQAGKIAGQRLERLVASIKEVLAHAIEKGGTTLQNFVDSDGNQGYFKQQLLVYGRQNQPCRGCGTILLQSRLGQRATVYCKHCQR